MARGQDETSTSQARRRKRPSQEMPYATNLISSMSMEEFISYYQIPDNISLELSDGLAALIVGEADNTVYFTQT